MDCIDAIMETNQDFEILVTMKTLKENLVTCRKSENDSQITFSFEVATGSDVIIHILGDDDNPEEYVRFRSGFIASRRNFMYTKKYIKCRVMPTGRLIPAERLR